LDGSTSHDFAGSSPEKSLSNPNKEDPEPLPDDQVSRLEELLTLSPVVVEVKLLFPLTIPGSSFSNFGDQL
jgi:hypothetical protein